MIEIIISIISLIIGPIIGIKIEQSFEKRKELPMLKINYPAIGSKPEISDLKENCTQVHGYYEMQKKFDDIMYNFLKSRKCDIKCVPQHFLKSIYEEYINIKNNNELKSIDVDVRKIITRFFDDFEFKRIMKKYEVYYMCSKWTLSIQNIGNTIAYDFEVRMFGESASSFKGIKCDLKPNEKNKIILYYFDKSLKINEYSLGNFQGSWNRDKMSFYLISAKKYNQIDERLFAVTYKDKYNKEHNYYCCACIINNNSIGGEFVYDE